MDDGGRCTKETAYLYDEFGRPAQHLFEHCHGLVIDVGPIIASCDPRRQDKVLVQI